MDWTSVNLCKSLQQTVMTLPPLFLVGNCIPERQREQSEAFGIEAPNRFNCRCQFPIKPTFFSRLCSWWALWKLIYNVSAKSLLYSWYARKSQSNVRKIYLNRYIKRYKYGILGYIGCSSSSLIVNCRGSQGVSLDDTMSNYIMLTTDLEWTQHTPEIARSGW